MCTHAYKKEAISWDYLIVFEVRDIITERLYSLLVEWRIFSLQYLFFILLDHILLHVLVWEVWSILVIPEVCINHIDIITMLPKPFNYLHYSQDVLTKLMFSQSQTLHILMLALIMNMLCSSSNSKWRNKRCCNMWSWKEM